jgi:hypothetical protein
MEPTLETGAGVEIGTKPLGAVAQIDDRKIRAHLDEGGARDGGRDAERAAGRGGGASVRSAEVRTDGRAQRHAGRWSVGSSQRNIVHLPPDPMPRRLPLLFDMKGSPAR